MEQFENNGGSSPINQGGGVFAEKSFAGENAGGRENSADMHGQSADMQYSGIYGAKPQTAESHTTGAIPAVSQGAAVKKSRSFRAWMVAMVVSAILIIAAVMILLALYAKNSVGDTTAPVDVGEDIGAASGVTVNIAVTPKPVEKEEYYADRQTGLLTPAGAAAQVLPSVVNLYGYTNTIIAPYSEASGVIISEDGYIITNAHAVEELNRVKVKLSDDREFEASIIGVDTKTDLAVLKIEADELTPAVIGSADELVQGEEVVAIGNAGGYNNTVTVGCVSHTDRTVKSYTDGDIECVQTDAVLNFGNSGGALVNLYGQVVGIVTSRYSSTGDENIGFAIKTDFAIPIVEDLIEKGYVTGRPRVGVTYTLLTADAASMLEVKPGMLIDEISADCSISQTRLQKDDIITSLDGRQILTDSDIKAFQSSHKPGDTVTAEVYRKSITGETEEFEITFTLEENK